MTENYQCYPSTGNVIYTDSNNSISDKANTRMSIKSAESDIRCSLRNFDHYSVYRSEVVQSMKFCILSSVSESNSFVLMSSRGSIQYLKVWPKIMKNKSCPRHYFQLSDKS